MVEQAREIVHLPVLNLSEVVFARCSSESDSKLVAAEIVSPAQCLPEANTGTIRQRWSQWSLLSSRGVGQKILAAPETRLNEVVASIPWKTVVMVRDNLVVNDCILCLEEEVLSAARSYNIDNDVETTILSMPCCAHSAVLCMKPLLEALDGLPGKLVKLAHLLESGRLSTDYTKQIRRLASEVRIRSCARLPDVVNGFREKARRILELSRPAQDLTREQETFILNADNGDWDHDEIVHYCIGSTCPLGCGGDQARSRELVASAIVLAVGGSMTLPLLYRWKGFEKAVAWAWRAARLHGLTHKAWNLLFPPKKS